MKELIEQIAKALVDSPDEVSVQAVEGEQTTVLELRVAQSDLGKVIGKQESNGTVYSNHSQRCWNETEEAVHARNPGVSSSVATRNLSFPSPASPGHKASEGRFVFGSSSRIHDSSRSAGKCC